MAGTIQLALGLAFVVAALALREPLEDDLFEGSSTLYAILIVAVLAYAVSYFARGYLAGSRRFGLYGGLVLMESGSRILFALAVAVGIASGQSVVALGHRGRADRVARRGAVRRSGGCRGARRAAGAAEAEPARGDRVHAGPRLGVRGGGARDHARRADLPQRRAAAGEGHRGGRGRGARGLHLQRAADRPGAAAAVPGGADLDPPPPHAARRARGDRSLPSHGERDPRWPSRASRRWWRS